MASKVFRTRIALKNDTAGNWSGSSFNLLAGEFGWDSTNKNFKIGDGSHSWNVLDFALPAFNNAQFTANTANSLKTYSISHLNSDLVFYGAAAQNDSIIHSLITSPDDGTNVNLKSILDAFDSAIRTAQAGGVQTIGGKTGTVGLGLGLEAGDAEHNTIGVKTTGYVTAGANGVDLDSSKIDSAYTVANTTNIATVATVTAAIGGLNVTEFALASKSGKAITIKGIKEDAGKIAIGTTTANDITFADVASTGNAEDVAYDNTDSGLEATNVQAAIDELASGTANDITDVQINSGTVVSSKVANIAADGTYNASTNKLATQSTVTTAIGALTVAEYAQGVLANDNLSFSIKGIAENAGLIGAGQTDFTLNFADAYNASSSKIATQTTVTNAVQAALDAEVTFKGVTSSTPQTPTNGDMWKAGADFTLTGNATGQPTDVKANDTIIYKNETGETDNGWYVIRHDSDTDTWRAIQVGGTELLGSAISTGAINFIGSAPISITGSGNAITVAHTYTADDEPGAQNPNWTSLGAVKIKIDAYGHVRSAGAITASDVTRTATTAVDGTTVEAALADLASKISTAGLTIDGYRGAITTGNGLNHVAADGGSFSVKLDTSNSNGLSVGSSGIGMDVATNSSFGTVEVTNGNGLSINNGIVSYAHNTTAITVASKDTTTNVITVNGTLTPDASDTITPSNAITFAPVAATGAASDLTVTSGTYGGSTATTSAQQALDNLTAATSAAVGTINTTNTSPLTPAASEATNGTINLHRVSKTGKIADLTQDTSQNEDEMIIFDCGSATVCIAS